MKNFVKKVLTSSIAAMVLATSVSAFGVGAESGSWSTDYGRLTGSAYATSWSTSGSPVYARVVANGSVEITPPCIYAGIVGYFNGSRVLSDETTNSNSSSAYAMAQSTAYNYRNLSGTGTFAVWGSGIDRIDHTVTFASEA